MRMGSFNKQAHLVLQVKAKPVCVSVQPQRGVLKVPWLPFERPGGVVAGASQASSRRLRRRTSAAERSYPTSEVRGRSWEDPMPKASQGKSPVPP